MTCTTHCPMSLAVNDMVKASNMENTECILCGNCVDGCSKNAILYRFGQAK
jgi:polyferredoxin